MANTVPKWLDITLNLLLLYILLAAGLTLGTWEYCMWQSIGAIKNNPGFVQRLEMYAEAGQAQQTVMTLLTLIEPFAIASKQAKSAGFWDYIFSLPDIPYVDVDSLIRLVDQFLASGGQLNHQLQSLTRLHTSAAAVEQYMVKPTRESQLLLYSTLVPHAENIDLLVANLDSANEMIGALAESIAVVSGGLEKTKLVGNFLTKPLAGLVHGAVAPVHQHIFGLHASLLAFNTDLVKDAISINTVVSSTRNAVLIESIVAPGLLKPVVKVVTEHIVVFICLIVIYLLLRTRFSTTQADIIV